MTHKFDLILPDVEGLDGSTLDALYEARCFDASVGLRGGVVRLAFLRRAGTREGAIRSAIDDLRVAGFRAVESSV